ncbi:LOW QUALITY PROTEIN: equilibrative nucleoside transporter 1-like [Uloborus diversus]|uniref:LOW QUALITY PROTEIN: equilibrative nucleoside transporter 1-like n=1 Tax=Uloborus diversus TaxID=327109 RepID=UPI002409261F|nr:LOW QUALITY PROTEIN: equilibrative nucleoside transporter 1-like [Uloborus diversus]
MSNIQFDYSTLSTSISRSELNSIIGRHFIDSNYDISEEASSEGSSQSTDVYVQPSPRDKYNIVYVIFGLFGIATLLPWNFFITANDYWLYKFRDTVSDHCIDNRNKTSLQAAFTSYITVSNNVPYVTFLVLCTLFSNRFSKMFRVVASLVAMLILFMIITSFVEINTDGWQMWFFTITIIIIILVGTTSAIFQAGISGIASLLPAKYMHILVLGQAFAGILAAVAQILSLLGKCDSTKSAFMFFSFADIVLLLALLSYIAIQKSEFFQYHVHSLKDTILKEVSESEEKTRISVLMVIQQIWPYALSIVLDFWITIGIFPSLAVLVVSNSQGTIWNDKLFLPVTCFLMFNISDFCGRAVGGWLPIPSTHRMHLLTLSSMRIIFIPLFMLCNAHPRHYLPVIFSDDIYYIIFITLLGFSNGYLIAVAMMIGIKSVNPLLQEMAGTILSTFLGAGLMLGALSSCLFINII